MNNFFVWVKKNFIWISIIVVMCIATGKIITSIEKKIINYCTGNTTTISNDERFLYEKQIDKKISDDKISAEVTIAMALRRLPKNGEVYIAYRDIDEYKGNGKININLDKYTEVKLENITALTFQGRFKVPTDKNYEMILLIRSDEGTVTENLEELLLARVNEQIPTFKGTGGIYGSIGGQYSYNIFVMNGHNNNDGNKFKDLKATILFKDDEIFSINLLENGNPEQSMEGVTTYTFDGLEHLKNEYGSSFGEDMKIIIQGKTNNGEEFNEECLGK